MKKTVFFSIFFITTFFFNCAFAEVYQYTNAAGRVVQTNIPQTKQENPGTVVSRHCREKWDGDYKMMKYCMDNQMESNRRLHHFPPDIIQPCIEKWGENYRMIEHCAKEQSEAKRRLGM